MRNWRNLLVVFGAAVVAFVAYDVAIGPALSGLLTKTPEQKAAQ